RRRAVARRAGGVAAGAGADRHATLRLGDEDLDDAAALRGSERRTFAGRPARNEKMNAAVDLPAAEPADAGLVEIAALRKRRHERRADSSEWCSHDDLPALSALPAP